MTRRRSGGDPQQYALLVLVAVVVVAVAAVDGVALAARALSGEDGAGWPSNPFTLAALLVSGRLPWPTDTQPVAVAIGVLLIALAVAVGIVVRRRAGRRSRVDHLAGELGVGRDLARLAAGTGPLIGRAVAGGRVLRRGREDVSIFLFGPRAGKTSSQTIEAVVAAPGAVVATSNKRDLVDATREVRAGRGMVWVFDPNTIAGETPGWWWNPLSYVTDETKARQLARTLTTAQREPGAKTDDYFAPAAQTLLGNLLLAAACSGRLITDVSGWLTRSTNRTPVELLRAKGYGMQADAVESVIELNPKQRGGIYGGAEQTMSFLGSRAVQAWVTPPGGQFDVQFDPHAFARSTDSLYLLSKEGEGSGGPIVTALTVAVVEAAIRYATTSPGGRLPVPMTVELDEAANICRWSELPDLYSHLGSQGILAATYLQSYAQGEAVWGQAGMRKLWTAANIAVVGPGVREVGFLGDVSQLAGDYDLTRRSTGYGRSGRSTNYSIERRRILPVAELAALPGPEDGDFSRARLLVLTAGSPPVLVRPVPWWQGEHADAVRGSRALHDPGSAGPLPQPQDVPRPGERWRR